LHNDFCHRGADGMLACGPTVYPEERDIPTTLKASVPDGLVSLRFRKEFRPTFMAPGTRKDELVRAIEAAIASEIREMGWVRDYQGGIVEVRIREFDEHPRSIEVMYWHPPWGTVVREMIVTGESEGVRFWRSAKDGISESKAYAYKTEWLP